MGAAAFRVRSTVLSQIILRLHRARELLSYHSFIRRYLTKSGSHKMPEGGHWKPERVVIIEFPDMNALNAWYNAPE
jgi:uncharacterized protein (DUF1330 family)